MHNRLLSCMFVFLVTALYALVYFVACGSKDVIEYNYCFSICVREIMPTWYLKVLFVTTIWTIVFFILVTAVGGRPKPELCFLPGRLRWTLFPKERYGNSLSGCRSNTQPSNWEPDTLARTIDAPLYYWAVAAPNNYFCAMKGIVRCWNYCILLS